MREEKKAAPRLVVYLSKWKPEQYDTDSSCYRIHILYVEEDGKPRNCSRSGEYHAPGTGMFEDFEMSCHMTWRDGQFTASSFETRYHGYMYVELKDAEVMLKTLKRAAKISDAFPVRPQTFGQYVALMASGFGVKECCKESHESNTGFYTDSEWLYLPLHYAQGWIDEEIESIRKARLELAS